MKLNRYVGNKKQHYKNMIKDTKQNRLGITLCY